MTAKARPRTPRNIANVNRIRDGSIDVDVGTDDFNTACADSAARSMQIFDPNKPLGMQKLLIKHHLFGDWGDSDSDEIELNDFAVANELRVMGTYRIADWRTQQALSPHERAELPTLWILTQYDRTVTSVILPSQY